MTITVLGKKEDVKKMQTVSDTIKKICTEANIKAEIKLTHNFAEVSGQSFNVAATPIIFFNGKVEFTGIPEIKLLQNKIIQFRNTGNLSSSSF